MEKKLAELLEQLKKAFGDQLISIVLYGSGATSDWREGSSDLNILCVVDRITPRELGLAEPILRWWHEAGNPAPLLLTPEEVRSSTDCYPMEFHDMKQHRRVLYGADLIEALEVDNKYYRAQVEQELRSKQLRLRQRAAEILSRPDRLQRLMTDSVSTFCVLGRHALVLAGETARWNKQELVEALGRHLGHPLTAVDEILSIRSAGKRSATQETTALLERYLTEVAQIVAFVDQLQP
jgi:predicted nucleotidyltransferase